MADVYLQGFEGQNTTGLEPGFVEYAAPVEGFGYGTADAGQSGAWSPGLGLQSGETITFTVWARSLYAQDHYDALQGPLGAQTQGNSANATAQISLSIDGTVLSSASVTVDPKALVGAPETVTNDDGANVIVDADAGYRHAFSENHFYQPIASDPINDPWFVGALPLAFQEADMLAKAVATFPDGQHRLYGFNSNNPFCEGTGETCQAVIFADINGSGAPLYDVPEAPIGQYVVWNSGDEDPWLGDPHVFVDPATSQVWLTVGGGTGIYVAELDAQTGLLKGTDGPVEFDARSDLFTQVANWSGDEWTGDSEWMEGAALWREGDFWYLFISYGDLSDNYTIRMGRSENPTGPFLDKAGRDLAAFDPSDAEFGNSFLLGDDGDQLLPGHPHLWQEGDTTYLGYDYRLEKGEEGREPFDYLGVREIEWVNGWPTIWTPLTVSISAADHPDLVGREVTASFANIGGEGSVVGFDMAMLQTAPDLEPPAPDAAVTLAILGDSITEGDTSGNYPALLSAGLGDEVNVVNLGVSGATLVRDSYLPIWDTGAFRDLTELAPDVVLVMLGTNDVSEDVPEALFANFERDLRDLVATLDALPGQQTILLATPPPLNAASQEGDAKLQSTVIPAIRAVAAETGLTVIDVNAGVDDYPANYPDQLHPNAEGLRTLADLMRPAIDGAVAALRADIPDSVVTTVAFYEALLDRDGAIDPAGLNFWVDALETGTDVGTMIEAFLRSDEYTTSFGALDGLSDAAFLTTLYASTFERVPDDAGFAFWLGVAADPSISRADIARLVALSPEHLDNLAPLDVLIESAPGVWDFSI